MRTLPANSAGNVVIIGAGLAGMTAGVYLSDAGYKVQIFEANRFIGGRTSSWDQDGMMVESGLHRFLGFYTALPDVLKKVGIDLDKMLCWEDEIEIRTAGQENAVFGLSPLHKPLKTFAAALGNNDFLPPADKMTLSAMFAAGAKEYVTDPQTLDGISVLAYAKRHGVSERAIHHLLVPLTEGIFFLPIARYSMYNLMGLAMPYLTSLPKLRVGAFMGGMSDVMMAPMAAYITARGGTVRTATPVEQLTVTNEKVRGVVAQGQRYGADHVIMATSLSSAQTLLRPSFAAHPALQRLFALPSMPAVTFQLELRSPSMDVDRTTFGPGTSLASFAEQSRTTFRGSKGRLSVILSPPEKFITMPEKDILQVVIADAERLGLHLKDNVVACRAVRLPADFYSLATANDALRPPQNIGIAGLTLAGDYTKQPYLATMEGAVVSGKNAAELLIER